MLGGYQIIDLSGMSVTMGSNVTITDLNVLKQLLALREHIEENYNYSKPLDRKLKAVMIRLRDAKNGEKTEGCLWGNLSIIDNNLSFNIDAVVSVDPLKVLQIKVVFEKKQDEDGNDYYDIKTAKYEFRGGQDAVTVTDIKAIPSATINKLDCGDIVLKKDASGYHAYIVSFRNATGICLTYTDAYCVETQSYDKVGQNWVYNSEDKTILNSLEQIYDKDGHNRFIEGVVECIDDENITTIYGKWSLSGTHLMIVLCFSLENALAWTTGFLSKAIELPDWIKDKIIPVYTTQVVPYIQITGANADATSSQYLQLSLRKSAQGSINIQMASITTTDKRYARIQFDLLIDNE